MLAALVACVAVAACTQQATAPAGEVSPEVKPQELTAIGAVQAMQSAGLPITDIVEYTAESDTNQLLGRPGQYIGKVNWNDLRHPPGEFGDDKPNTIEAFATMADMAKRKDYIEQVTGASPMFLQYITPHKKLLMRLDKGITPDQAAEYKRALESL